MLTLPTVLSTAAIAQVSPDTTLANPSDVSFDGTVYDITEGITRDTTLFHSFESFSLSSGETAQFSNNAAIENIISRVTGPSRSRINGLIEANGDANLFLLNPNGIVFGANAELNIGGSFLATTADSFLFDDGEYSAITPQDPPLLAISTPIGLQFGSDPGPIRVNGPGNGLFIDPEFFDVVRSDRPSGLEVAEGQTLALVGGKLIFNGGNVSASQGRIELGSVGNEESVLLNLEGEEWDLDYAQVNDFDSIRLVNTASVDVSGEGGGNVQIYGQTMEFTDGSAIVANTLGGSDGGSITLQASDSISMEATSTDDDGLARLPSGIFAEVSLGATGSGATVSVETPQLSLSDGAQISIGTFSQGNAGNLNVVADNISILRDALFILPSNENEEEQYFSSGFLSVVDFEATGQSGTINIQTNTLSISDFAEVSALTFGAGNAGAILIDAENIILARSGAILANADNGSTGSGGGITINTETLTLEQGGQLLSTAFADGDGGTIDIKAQAVNMLGRDNLETLLATDVRPGATGNGGQLSIQTDSLLVTNGAQISVTTAGGGTAGDLNIDAQTIEIRGFDDFASSGLLAIAVVEDGDGGTMTIRTNQLKVLDGATITAGNFGTIASTPSGSGDAGSINIDADLVQLDSDGSITTSSLDGEGDINVDSEVILLTNQSAITTNAFGDAPGGNIEIDARLLFGFGNSDITANAVNDRGGQIIITADNALGFQVSDLINPAESSTNDITASSRLGSQFNGLVKLNTPDSDSTQLVVRLEDDVVDQSNLVGSVCRLDQEANTLVITGAGGLPDSPFQYLGTADAWSDLRLTAPANRLSSQMPKLPDAHEQATRQHDSIDQLSLSEVTAWQRTSDGRIELMAKDAQQGASYLRTCNHT
ncbi:MAG: filamentous hemagglutinin N-terminal domain-containing protein [Cyanobacteria bacterium P01_F01_bin.150]